MHYTHLSPGDQADAAKIVPLTLGVDIFESPTKNPF